MTLHRKPNPDPTARSLRARILNFFSQNDLTHVQRADISCFHDLASQAWVGIVTVRQIEAGVTKPRHAMLIVLRQTPERAGIEFIDENGGGPGVRLRKRQRLQNPK